MENHNNKVSNSCKKNPRLTHKHRYVKFLSNGLMASRSGLSLILERYYIVYYNKVLNLRLGDY